MRETIAFCLSLQLLCVVAIVVFVTVVVVVVFLGCLIRILSLFVGPPLLRVVSSLV